VGTVSAIVHDYSQYTHGCRCEECRSAKRNYMRRMRSRTRNMPQELHGTYTGYDNWGCRCWKCRVAKSTHRATTEKENARRKIDIKRRPESGNSLNASPPLIEQEMADA